MSLLGIDLGGTKLNLALFRDNGLLIRKETLMLDKSGGAVTAAFIREKTSSMVQQAKNFGNPVQAIGVSVPGISRKHTGTVWAPNIPGWENYPLLQEIQAVSEGANVRIESDRNCYVWGERWQGKAKDCNNFIFLAIGTGIGAGILANGQLLEGAHGSAGAMGWMTMQPSWIPEYARHGYFECWAAGDGMARLARKKLHENNSYHGALREMNSSALNARVIFAAADQQDILALEIIEDCVKLWGMGIANLVSLFDPALIVLGGGVFGPAGKYLPQIREEAFKWAQPQSMPEVEITLSAMGSDAGVYGAGYLALNSLKTESTTI